MEHFLVSPESQSEDLDRDRSFLFLRSEDEGEVEAEELALNTVFSSASSCLRARSLELPKLAVLAKANCPGDDGAYWGLPIAWAPIVN